MSLLFSVLLLYNRRGEFYNKVKRKSTGAELMTIKEIAKLAQVSSAAVSRYMNGGYVSEEKKERIRAVIEETGYRPSVQARTLRTKRACLVGVIVPKINSESISRITEGIGQVLSERAYQMLLTITDNDPSKELEYMDLFESYPVDGIILVGTVLSGAHKEKLKKCRVPIVVIGQQTNEVSCIYHDDYGAAKELAEQIGKEMSGRIAYIGVTRADKAAGAAREDGFRDGLRAVGRELEEGCLRRASFTMESGYEQACDLLRLESDIDIISCATDTIAAGVIEAIAQLSPQRSIQVTGFGDNQFLKAVTGGIRTVHFGYQTSGVKGARLLLDMVESGETLTTEIKLGYELL